MSASMEVSKDTTCSENNPNSLPLGGRKFYQIPENNACSFEVGEKSTRRENVVKLMQYVNNNIVGRDFVFAGPWGPRKSIYCDYTASARSVEFIEDYIKQQVLPVYGNTHTTTTVSSLQTTLYRHEARDIIRNAVNASEHDAVIFVGSGCTGAVHKLINGLNLQQPPVVLFSPYEHHSNLLPWRELGAEMVSVPEDANGLVDTKALQLLLQKWQPSGRQLIGCFSAASNVTGILTDTVAITTILHQYGALAFWDYATAGPYVDIDMNPVITTGTDPSLACKDALYLSPHKFVGGVETPGILVVKKKLFRNPVPTGGGGGAVFFVTGEDHRYLQQVEMREEGGTPSIIGAIRAGMAFQLKQAIGPSNIMEREHQLCKKAIEFWSSCQNLILLGNTIVPRLPIFSFLIRHPVTGQFLHHNFVCAVLNDVFGIQSRGGCACAGPYAQRLLGIHQSLAKQIEALLLEDHRLDRVHLRRYHEYSEKEILRPGFTRLNLPYFMDDECVDFVLSAVAMVAEHGWKLLPQYMFNPETGEWKQRNHQVFQDRRWLGSISYASGKMSVTDPPRVKHKGKYPDSLDECLSLAQNIFQKAEKTRIELADQSLLFDIKAEKLLWFMLPSEAQVFLNSRRTKDIVGRKVMPFEPPDFNALSQLQGNDVVNTKSEDCRGEERDRNETAEICSNEISWHNAHYFQSTVEHGFVGGSEDKLQDIDSANAGQQVAATESIQNDAANSDSLGQCAIETSGLDKLGKIEDKSLTDPKYVSLNVLPNTSPSCYTQEDQNFISNERTKEETTGDSIQSSLQERTTESICSSSTYEESAMENLTITVEGGKTEAAALNTQTKTDSDFKTFQFSKKEPVSQICELKSNGNECLPCMLPRRNVSDQQMDEATQMAGDKAITTSVKFHAPPKKIFKPTLQALEEYQMLQDRDRVLVCLSGGKDSLSLLHTLRQYQFVAKKKGIHFDLGAVTVDPQTASFDPSPLKGYLKTLGLPYFYEEQCIIEQAASLKDGCESICSFCSRMKRGRLYACARREGYNVLAMGQHLDDLAESFLMSVFHNGLLRTMKANYSVKEGDLRVIRPFVYVREKHLREFAEQRKLPVIPENCPACFEAPKERHRNKQLLAGQEVLFPQLYSSIQTALKPLMAKNKTGMESSLYKNTSKGTFNLDDNDDDI